MLSIKVWLYLLLEKTFLFFLFFVFDFCCFVVVVVIYSQCHEECLVHSRYFTGISQMNSMNI